MQKVVIATKLPGIYNEFGENHGIVYVDNACEVLDTVQNILNKGEYDEIAKNGREFVKSSDWEIKVDEFEDALNELI